MCPHPTVASLNDEIAAFTDEIRRVPLINLTCKMIGVTGPSCAGKSRLLRDLAEHGFDSCFVFMAETYSGLVEQGLLTPVPAGLEPALFNAWMTRNQCHVVLEQMRREAELGAQAEREHKALIVDRLVTDGLAYFPEGLGQLLVITGQPAHRLFRRYDLILDLLPPPEEVYDREHARNPARTMRDYGRAIARAKKHSMFIDQYGQRCAVIAYNEDWQAKMEMVVATIIARLFPDKKGG